MSVTTNLGLRGENAQELTVLECIRKLEQYKCKSMTIQFDNAPMIVRITLESPKTTAAMEEARRGGLPSFDGIKALMADLEGPKKGLKT